MGSSFKKEIDLNLLAQVGLILLFMPPDGFTFSGPEIIELGSKTLLVIAFFAMLLSVLKKMIKGTQGLVDSISILILILSTTLTVSTILNEGDLFLLGQKIIYLAGPWLFVALFGLNNPEKMFKALYYAFLIVFVLNMVSFIWMYPQNSFRPDEGDYWLFGQRNYMRNILYPSIVFSLINDRKKNRKISPITILMIGISPIILLFAHSATSLVTCIIMEILLLLVVLNKKRIHFSRTPALFSLGSPLVLNCLVVFLRIQNMFSFLIVDILGKDLTLSKRTEVWDLVQDRIPQAPIFGTGIQKLQKSGITLESGKQLSNAHNQLMDTLYKGGVFSLLAFILLLWNCCRPLWSLKSMNWLRAVMSIAVFSFFVEAIFGDIWFPQFFLLMYLCAYIEKWKIIDER